MLIQLTKTSDKYSIFYFIYFLVGAVLEASLAVLLFYAIIEVSVTTCKIFSTYAKNHIHGAI